MVSRCKYEAYINPNLFREMSFCSIDQQICYCNMLYILVGSEVLAESICIISEPTKYRDCYNLLNNNTCEILRNNRSTFFAKGQMSPKRSSSQFLEQTFLHLFVIDIYDGTLKWSSTSLVHFDHYSWSHVCLSVLNITTKARRSLRCSFIKTFLENVLFIGSSTWWVQHIYKRISWHFWWLSTDRILLCQKVSAANM